MKVFCLFIGGLVLILSVTILTIAQTEKTQPVELTKIGVICLSAFEDKKTGIKELVEANEKLENEFIKPANDDLKLLYDKYDKLIKEFRAFSGLEPPPISVIDNKIKELSSLEIEIKKKQEELKLLYARRYAEIIGPVNTKIARAIDVFAKRNGFAIIFDSSLLEKGVVLGDPGPDNVTKEFIKFYNEHSDKEQIQQ